MKFYFMEKGQAYLISQEDAREVEKAILGSRPVCTHGRTIYPIYDEPSPLDKQNGKTRIALVIHDGQLPTVRWYWQIREHTSKHHGCKVLGDGLCGFKMVRCMNWNDDTKKWELLPAVNHATPEQEQVLDAF